MNIAPPVESRAVAGGGGASARRVLPLRSIVGAAVVIDATLIVLADLLSFSLRYGIDVRDVVMGVPRGVIARMGAARPTSLSPSGEGAGGWVSPAPERKCPPLTPPASGRGIGAET